MSVIFFLIGIGVFVAGGFLFAFIWAVKSGQYDDDYTPSVRMLFENKKSENNKSERKETDTSTRNHKEVANQTIH